MQSFSNRKQLRGDPFGMARRGADFRLEQLREKILSRFRNRQERDIMRRTLKELMEKEQTFQGKVDRLIAIAGGIELTSFQDDFLDTQDSFMGDDSVIGCRRVCAIGSEEFGQGTNHQSTQYSPFGVKSRKYPIENSRKLYHNYSNRSITSSGQLFNHENSLSRPNNLNYSRSSLLSNNNESAIDEKDLFSFRTQQGTSPVQPNKHHFSDHSLSGLLKQDMGHSRAIQYTSRSKSGKKDQLRHKSPGIKQKSKGKRLTPPKQTNYDGQGLIYLDNPSSYSKVKHAAKSKKKSMDPQSLKKIMKRIGARLQFSSCVVGTLSHSTPTQNDNYVSNRFKHELQARSQLISEISSTVAKHRRWV